MSTPLERAESAMQEAQKELKEAKARFTAVWKRRNGEELTDQYDQDMKVELKELNDSLAQSKETYNLLLRQQSQQGLGG